MIRFDQVSKHYADDKIALKPRDLSSEARAKWPLLPGHSGAGKKYLA